MAWDVLVGETVLGRLTANETTRGVTHCTFEPGPQYTRFARAFTNDQIWEGDDDDLDAIIDQLAVDGVFLVAEDGSEIVDPDLRIDGADASFTGQSSSNT